jgi:predicted transcriptional regulator
MSRRTPAAAHGPARARVLVALSREQVDGVIDAASAQASLSLLLAGVADLRDVLANAEEQLKDGRLSRSLLQGLLVFAAVPADGSYAGITAIARTLGMSMSTAHRYLSTLVAAGLIERDPASRRYRLAHAR